MERKLRINWYGSVSQGQGYSGSGEHICIELEKIGCDIRNVHYSKTIWENLTEEGKRIRSKPFEMADIAICYGFPVAFSSIDSYKYRFGMSMFETDRLPSGKVWAGSNTADSCSKLNMLFVPSEHSKKLFSDSGVTVPIEVVHLGVNMKKYYYLDRPKKRKTFTFLLLGNLTIRKNPGLVVSAFISLFGNKPDVRLVIKTTGGSIPKMIFPVDNIEVVDRYATPEEMFQYYYDADCFVFPSRGEGFGLPPLEAMATGLPTIFSNNTGMMEFADPTYNYPIPSTMKSKAVRFPPEWGDVGNWWETDIKDLKNAMLSVYNNKEEAREKGKLASEWVKNNWGFDKTALRIVELVKKVYN